METRTTYHAKVTAGGKIVIPADLRRKLGIRDGDTLRIERDGNGALSVRTHERVVAEGQRAYRAMLERPFTVDEFIADRCDDAAHD